MKKLLFLLLFPGLLWAQALEWKVSGFQVGVDGFDLTTICGGPFMHLDASDSNNLWTDASRTTHPTTDGETLAKADGISTNAHLFDITFDFWHTWDEAYQNSLDVIQKTDNGNSNRLETTFTAESFDSVTFIMVGEVSTIGTVDLHSVELYDDGGTAANAIRLSSQPSSETGWGFVYNSYEIQLHTDSAITAATFHLIVVEIDFVNRTANQYVDGTLEETDTTTGAGSAMTGIDTLRLSGNFDVIGEFLIYQDCEAYTDNKSGFDNYIDTKWAITGL